MTERPRPLARTCAWVVLTILVALATLPAPAAALPDDLSCEAPPGGGCGFLCVPGMIEVVAYGSSGYVSVQAYCDGQLVVGCSTYGSSCTARAFYLGPPANGHCIAGSTNSATCRSALIDLNTG